MCPRCGQNAPLVYRGVVAYCTACNAPRPPLTGKALHLAGQTSRVGGVLARVVGWSVLGIGLTVAVILGVVFQALFPQGFAGLLIGLPLAVVSLLAGIALLRGGSSLGRKGDAAEKSARAQAVFALAAHRGGALTAVDVAQSLELSVADADALLTGIAREDYERVGVDVDPNGALVYRFVTGPGGGVNAPGGPRVRVDPEVARSPNRDEWERLQAQEAEEANARQRARAR